MKIFLGIGSNEGDRLVHLESAVKKIQDFSRSKNFRVSPLYETPAMLPERAPANWNRPFLNAVIEVDLQCTPFELLQKTKRIEIELGRGEHEHWAPRAIDIDLLLWGDEKINSSDLVIPHPRLQERAFVLDPLKDLNSHFLPQAKKHPQHSPLWMGVINLTPDSFSGSDHWSDMRSDPVKKLDDWDEHFIAFLDVGAESTRPGATPLGPEEEWTRLEPFLRLLIARYKGKTFRPMISVDTRHTQTAARALDLGVDMINDVSGLADSSMLELIKTHPANYVLMHSLSIPAEHSKTLPEDCDPTSELIHWFEKKTKQIEDAGISREKIWIDPGIGFGKTSLQSLEILKNIDRLSILPYKLLVGHSRKSFLSPFTNRPPKNRDLETIGVSLNLASKGVDALRVHDPIAHIRAFQAWNHVNRSTL